MALIKCPECGKEASDKAYTCPNCGYPFELLDETEIEESTVEDTAENEELSEAEECAAEIEELPEAEESVQTEVYEPLQEWDGPTLYGGKVKKSGSSGKRWIVPVAIITAIVILAALFTLVVVKLIDYEKAVEGVSASNKEKVVSTTTSFSGNAVHKDGTYEEIIDADVQAAVDDITAEYEKLSSDIGGTYSGYKKNTDKVAAWYSYCEERSTQLYATIAEDTYGFCQEIADGGISDYKTWYGMLSDVYEAWNGGLSDYYKEWNELYSDAYSDFNDVITDGYDEVGYDEASDAWDDMYDMHDDAWDNMYDLHDDAWSDIYDFYEDVFDEFYDGETDVKGAFEKNFKVE